MTLLPPITLLLLTVLRLWRRIPWQRCGVVALATVTGVVVPLALAARVHAASPTPSPTSEFVAVSGGSGPVWTAVWLGGPSGTMGSLDIIASLPLSGAVTATVDGSPRTLQFTGGAARLRLPSTATHALVPPAGTALVRINAGPTNPLQPIAPAPTSSPPPAASPTTSPTAAAPTAAAPTAAAPTSAAVTPAAPPPGSPAAGSGTPGGPSGPAGLPSPAPGATATASPPPTPSPTPTPTPPPTPTPSPTPPPGPPVPTPVPDQPRPTQVNLVSLIVEAVAASGDAARAVSLLNEYCSSVAGQGVLTISQCRDAIAKGEAAAKAALTTPSGIGTDLNAATAAEVQQVLDSTGFAGYGAQQVQVGGETIIIASPPRTIPPPALEPGSSAPVILRPGAPPGALPVVAPGCGGTVIGCVLDNPAGEVVTTPDGLTWVQTSTDTGLTVLRNPGGVLTPSDSTLLRLAPPDGATLNAQGTLWVVDGGRTAALENLPPPSASPEVPVAVGGAGRIGSFLRIGGRLLGVAGLAYGAWQFVGSLASGDLEGSLTHGTQLAFGAFMVFGGGSELIGVPLFLALGAGGPALVITGLAIIVFSVLVNLLVEWFFGDLFAPDLFVENRTGVPQRLQVTLATEGAHDVRPAWSNGTWDVTALPGGALRLPDGSTTDRLHYDLLTPAPWQRDRGWTVPRAGFAAWAQATLPAYGFSPAATAGFIRSWGDLGHGAGTITVYPQTGALVDRLEPLSARASSGVAVSVRRVWFVVTGGPPTTPLPLPVVRAAPGGPLDLEEWGVFLEAGADPSGMRS